MKKDELSQFGQPKIISKRRFVNGKREYLVNDGKSSLYIWKKCDRTIKREVKEYDDALKGILPYFPVLFQDCNDKVKIYCQEGHLYIEYNGKLVTIESNLTKKARVEILTELNKVLPVQVFQSMYHQGKERIRVDNMIRDIVEEEQELQQKESD